MGSKNNMVVQSDGKTNGIQAKIKKARKSTTGLTSALAEVQVEIRK